MTSKTNMVKEIGELKRQIDDLIKQKQMIIKKEGYPASDVIAVLRKEITEELIEDEIKFLQSLNKQFPKVLFSPYVYIYENIEYRIKQQLQSLKHCGER